MSHTQLNYAFLWVWSIFGLIHGKILFLVKKVTISERSSEKIRKFVFINRFENGQIQRKIWICCKEPFLSKAGQILTKTVFLNTMSHKQLIYAFLLVWSIFREIHWEILFLVKKLTISVRSSEILRKFVFLNKFEKEKILRKILICYRQPFLKSSKIG